MNTGHLKAERATMDKTMNALVYDRHGAEIARYAVRDEDTLSPDAYAERFGSAMGIELIPSKPGATIPDGCEDIRITIQEEPGSAVCWTSRNYLISAE